MKNRKDYPKDWDDIRQVVLTRDQHECQDCGIQQYAVVFRRGYWMCVYAVGFDYKEGLRLRLEAMDKWKRKFTCICLQVAHLDHDEVNHDVKLSRLKTLCPRCHFYNDNPDNQKRKKYGRRYKENQLKINSTHG